MADTSRSAGSNPLLRLLFLNWLIGAIVAFLVVGLVLSLDVGHLCTLIARARDPIVPIIMLVVGFMVVMCSVAMGTAVMGLGRDGNESGGRRAPGKSDVNQSMKLVAQPVRVKR